MALTTGDRLGRYEIVAPLGAGGMGEVYRARDTELEREVAVKVLPEAVAGDPARLERFRREARAVAALSHPHILQIFDFGRHDEVSYAVTELLEGDTLRELVTGPPLSWRRAREITAAVADGLAAAHARGIVHRDLKPENIFITSDGQVKILDFGLARFEGPVSTEAETGTLTPADTQRGVVVGTLGYMAPEQLKGEPADHRSDIFALGCVLYEMLSGRRAFLRDSAVETMAAILKEDPPPLSASGVTAAPEISRTIERCLEKRPERRFQSAADLGFALRSIVSDSGVARTAPQLLPPRGRRRWLVIAAAAAALIAATVAVWLERSESPGKAMREQQQALAFADAERVVVATFDNRTGDPSLDPMGLMAADLMTDGIVSNQVADVVPRSTARLAERQIAAGESTDDPLVALAIATEAPLVVSGAYYRQGEELSFQASVTNAVEGRVLYALDPVSGPPDGAGAAVRELRSRILSVIAMNFNPTAHSHLLSTPPRFEAYQEFMVGSELWGVDLRQGVQHMERACELDPDYFSPRIRLAAGYNVTGQYERADQIVEGLRQRRNALTAFERHWLDGLSASWEGQNAEALSHLRDIDEMVPDDAVVEYLIGSNELELNRPRLALEAFEQIDVTSLIEQWGKNMMVAALHSGVTTALHVLGEYERELTAARQGLEMFPDVYRLRRSEVRALAGLGRVEELQRIVDDSFASNVRQGQPEWVAIIAAGELRAHGHPAAGVAVAERAERWLRDVSESDDAPTADLRCDLLLAADRYSEALQACERASQELDQLELQARVGCLRARVGDRAGALEISDRLAALDRPHLNGDNTRYRAAITAHLGDLDGAIALLRRAIAEGSGSYDELHSSVLFEPLWGHAEFEEIVEPKG